MAEQRPEGFFLDDEPWGFLVAPKDKDLSDVLGDQFIPKGNTGFFDKDCNLLFSMPCPEDPEHRRTAARAFKQGRALGVKQGRCEKAEEMRKMLSEGEE